MMLFLLGVGVGAALAIVIGVCTDMFGRYPSTTDLINSPIPIPALPPIPAPSQYNAQYSAMSVLNPTFQLSPEEGEELVRRATERLENADILSVDFAGTVEQIANEIIQERPKPELPMCPKCEERPIAEGDYVCEECH